MSKNREGLIVITLLPEPGPAFHLLFNLTFTGNKILNAFPGIIRLKTLNGTFKCGEKC